MSPLPPPKVSLRHDWKRKLGSEHVQRPEGQVVQQSRSFQSNEPIPNLSRDRSEQPVVETNTENVPDGCETRSCHESMRLNVEDETLRDRTGQPVVNHDKPSHEQTMLNEVNMDFRIPGLPHSVVRHAQSTSVGELIQKIETTQIDTSTRSTTKQSLQPV